MEKTVLQELASLKLYIPSNAGGHPPPRGGAPKGVGKLQGRSSDVYVATNFGAVLRLTPLVTSHFGRVGIVVPTHHSPK